MNNDTLLCLAMVAILVGAAAIFGGIFSIFIELQCKHRWKMNHQLYPNYYKKKEEANVLYRQCMRTYDKIERIKEKIDGLIKQLDYTPMEYQSNLMCTIENLRKELYPLEEEYEKESANYKELDSWTRTFRCKYNIKE